MIASLCRTFNFPEEAALSMQGDFDRMIAVPGGTEILMSAMDDLFLGEGTLYAEAVKGLAEQAGVHRYAAEMVFGLCCARHLRYFYRQKGWPEDLFLNTMDDLRVKLWECKDNYDVWGTFVGYWFRGFFLGDRHGLGRLQYEPRPFDYEEYRGIKKGDPVYNCHIPSGSPLTEEAVLESLKKAYDFYRPEDGVLKVVCNSWMLYPPHYEVYPEGGNLRMFYNLFTVLSSREDPKNVNLWRIFGRGVDRNDLPAKSTLQRRLKAFLEAGNCMGTGYGILLFDGKKILK